MKAIITGADGFIGSAVAKNLLSYGNSVLGLDLFQTPRRLSLDNPRLKYYGISLQEIEKLSCFVKKGEYDVFFHFAWRGSGGQDRGNIDIQLENIALAVETMKEASALGCKKFVFVSSVVELEANQLTYQDDTKPDPHYIYGGAKSACHSLLKPLANQLGLDFVWANIAGVFGVGDCTPNFINSILKKIITGEPLLLTEGKQFFDFVYIDDVADAFRLIGESGKTNRYYVIGSGGAKPIRFFVEKIVELLKPNEKIYFGSIPYSGLFLPKETFAIDKLTSDCDFVPKVSFEDGIKKTFAWLKTQKN